MPRLRFHNSTPAAAILCFCLSVSFTQSLSAQAGGFRISGKVVSSVSGTPLAQTRVTIRPVGSGGAQSIITGESGGFVFANLPGGKYSLSASRRGFIEAMFDQHEGYSTAIVTGGAADSEHLVFRLTPEAILGGRVLDESGDPVRMARVTLYRQTQRTGTSRIGRAAIGRTDDRGTYEFAGLASGTYFVAVNAQPWYALHPPSAHAGRGMTFRSDAGGATISPGASETITAPVVAHSFDVTYATTYYGDASDSDEATPIPLRGGEHATADIHLSPVPALRILVRNQDGRVAIPQFLKKSFDVNENMSTQIMGNGSPGQPRTSNINILGNGLVEVTGLPAGKYTLRLPPMPSAGQSGSVAEFDITQNGQELNLSEGEPVSSVNFSVRASGAPLPQGLVLALQTQEYKIVRSAPVDAQGRCELIDIPPGRYHVLALTQAGEYAVKSVTVHGNESRGHELEIVAGTTLEAEATVIGGRATVEGTAKRDGRGIAGVMIVLVPADPEAHHELFRRDQSDLDGTFSLASVIPGEYTVVAIENGWDLNWSQPGVITHYAEKGIKLAVPGTVDGPIYLPGPIQVQSR